MAPDMLPLGIQVVDKEVVDLEVEVAELLVRGQVEVAPVGYTCMAAINGIQSHLFSVTSGNQLL